MKSENNANSPLIFIDAVVKVIPPQFSSDWRNEKPIQIGLSEIRSDCMEFPCSKSTVNEKRRTEAGLETA